MTALDAVGPYDVLSRIPRAHVRWVAARAGPVETDAGLVLHADYDLSEVRRPHIVVVPGGRQQYAQADPLITDWLRAVHRTTRYTTSVCTGALVLGAAGLLHGINATTHWYALPELKTYGANPVRQRVVQHGKIMTAAGVSAGIDMALRLARQLAGTTAAKVIQLAIEYDPHPPFASGSLGQASFITRWLARIAMKHYQRQRGG
jgi:transcriptional regulator GlxA family with amidase domain